MNSPSNCNPNREGKHLVMKIDTKDLLAQGHQINSEIDDKMEERAANRKLLRLLSDSGQLSEAEEQELLDLYPPRERGTAEVEEEE